MGKTIIRLPAPSMKGYTNSRYILGERYWAVNDGVLVPIDKARVWSGKLHLKGYKVRIENVGRGKNRVWSTRKP